MEQIKKMVTLIALFAILVGLVGGIGYIVYCKAYIIAVCLCVVAYAVYPTAKQWFKYLTA